MDAAHLLIRKDHKRNLYLIEAAMGADRITLATAHDHAEAFQIAQHFRGWTRRDPDNVPFPIYDKSTQLK
jgi:hypothetical protein